jgi:magnesium-transporting ATPase (P-type)
VATGLPMPLTAVQILWFNLVTEGIQDVALALERKEPDVMRRRPRPPGQPVFDRQMIEQCLVVGVYVAAVSFALFAWLHIGQGLDEFAARNLTLLFLVSFSNLHVLNCRSETRSILQVPLAANPFLVAGIVGAQVTHVVAMHIPFMQDVLSIGSVSLGAWAGTLALAGTVLLVGEGYKALRARPRAARLAVSG